VAHFCDDVPLPNDRDSDANKKAQLLASCPNTIWKKGISMVLQVSATPYNLLTKNSRIPLHPKTQMIRRRFNTFLRG